MKKNILKYILISLIVMGISVGAGVPCFSAQSRASLDQKLKQTNSKRNYFNEKKRQTDVKIRTERNRLSHNQQKLEETRISLDKSTKKYTSLQQNLTSMERQLSEAVAEFRTLDAQMKDRIRQVYKHQRRGMFELIFSSKDVSTMMDMVYYEKIIIRDDYKRMKALQAKADEIAALKAQVEQQKRMIEASIREMNYQRKSIQTSIAANQEMIRRLENDKSYYERSERELAKQSESIQNMIAKMTGSNSGGSNVVVSSTGFIRPISGPITSPFGYRIHPIFKSRIFHSGIDIGGPNGGAIKASNDGKVIYSGWYGGYGKVVILDHGVINGSPITTLYAHMSTIKVSNGQYVKKGQTVGLEGSTGYSTGPHCHFEVRVNGKPTNPFNYIK